MFILESYVVRARGWESIHRSNPTQYRYNIVDLPKPRFPLNLRHRNLIVRAIVIDTAGIDSTSKLQEENDLNGFFRHMSQPQQFVV